jgi:hypothetical protein
VRQGFRTKVRCDDGKLSNLMPPETNFDVIASSNTLDAGRFSAVDCESPRSIFRIFHRCFVTLLAIAFVAGDEGAAP